MNLQNGHSVSREEFDVLNEKVDLILTRLDAIYQAVAYPDPARGTSARGSKTSGASSNRSNNHHVVIDSTAETVAESGDTDIAPYCHEPNAINNTSPPVRRKKHKRHREHVVDNNEGQVSIPLSRIDLCQESEETATIEAPKKDHLGEICFSLRYVPQKSQLTVVILECKNLKKMDIGGLSDPYVKIAILQQGKRIKKSKTTIKMHTLNPYYNESFKFDVAPMLMSKIQLCLTVVDYDRVGSNDIIGKVTLGHGVGGNAQKHFTEVIEKPRRSIAQWHTLQPIEDKK